MGGGPIVEVCIRRVSLVPIAPPPLVVIADSADIYRRRRVRVLVKILIL